MAYKTFIAGEEALASDVNSYLMSQTVSRFATAAARTAAIASPVLNQLTMRDDKPGVIERWQGTAWVNLSNMFHAPVTGNVAVSNTSAAFSQDLVNSGSQPYDGGLILLEFFVAAVLVPTGVGVMVSLFDGTTDLGFMGAFANPGTANLISPMLLRRVITPTVGNHTYHATGWLNPGPGTATFFAGTGTAGGVYGPMYLSATKVG